MPGDSSTAETGGTGHRVVPVRSDSGSGVRKNGKYAV